MCLQLFSLSLSRTALDYRVQQLLQRLFPNRVHMLVQSQWWERVRLGSEGTVWVFFSLLLALFVPQISYVINPIGGLAAVLMFVFPGGWMGVHRNMLCGCAYTYVHILCVSMHSLSDAGPAAMSWLHLTLTKLLPLQWWWLCVVGMVCGWLLVLGTFVFGTSVAYNIMLDFHAL